MNADCGVTFDHDRHLYRNENGEVEACDGDTSDKRQIETQNKD